MGEVAKYVDTVNLMAYDYYEPEKGKPTGNHAPLFSDPADPRAVSADRSVRELEKAGVAARKLVLGVPFYGHVWGQVPATNHGLFQPGQQIPNTDASYAAIASTMLGHGYSRYWDAAASVPYLYSRARTATCGARFIVQLQHMVCRILSPTHCGVITILVLYI